MLQKEELELSILEELENRKIKEAIIDMVLKENLRRREGAKIMRGLVHSMIASKLSLELNYYLRRIVNERMEGLGYMRIIRGGRRMYKGAILIN